MKRLLTITLMLVLTLTTGAQGEWTKFSVKPDELIGEPGGMYYKYSVDTLGAIIIREGEEWKFKIETYSGGFYGIVYNGSVKRIPIVKFLMGLYDSSGNLIEKIDNDLQGDENLSYKSAWVNDDWPYTPGQRGKLKKMISEIFSGDGYVRIVVKRMDLPDWDMRITPYNVENGK